MLVCAVIVREVADARGAARAMRRDARVLVAVDQSQGAESAFHFALSLLSRNATIYALHVRDPNTGEPGTGGGDGGWVSLVTITLTQEPAVSPCVPL
ncbi:unnamed protein product [Closterium sp. NIES-53]